MVVPYTGQGDEDQFDRLVHHDMGLRGLRDGQFDHPQGIVVDCAGYVYVADTRNNRTQVRVKTEATSTPTPTSTVSPMIQVPGGTGLPTIRTTT